MNFDFNAVIQAIPYLFGTGMTFTLTLTLAAASMGLVLGTLLAVMRLSPYRLVSVPAGIYVNTLRSIPLLLVIFWFYFLMPYIGAWVTGASRPINIGAYKSAIITFTLFEAAYFCEIMRAGIQSVSRGQMAAGLAIGLTYRQAMQSIILPQAVRNMLPSLVTRVIILFQDTSLVYVLSLTDFLGAGAKIGQRDGRLVELYLFVALVYWVICFSASRVVKFLERRTRVAR
ncbi:amino acid ABC transporter permease [Pseudomonas typographi]|uniref:Amino acid ABC transporter permease n=1 Tax=Pseudomonas typographi TaxID=2715964 RepID=A0ABR7YZZ2_9PSED|nr:amino acid ABC transporter permease [Pseudomonas typographi]MBD1550567.1 amino acid ABC transporter permease [Pseudomonas typographi]MBD1586847.1 amino acid ABC transporter permease [Pseudomonas typographi]MBD1598742.1 amino acid ABC transporter permease [Pseudomonas typographi]